MATAQNDLQDNTRRYSGLIFDIKHYAIHDGPGIRTTIFLKGCPLSCIWCHNPESRSPKIQKLYSVEKCIGCRQCIEICPEDACSLTADGIHTDQEKCIVCGTCADNCPAEATEMSGRMETVDNILKVLEKELLFFDQSGGGVTFSGGEPLMFPNFLITLLDACGEKGIHRTVDTTGFTKTETILKVSQRTELFLYDLKHMDTEKHRTYTGVDNERILHNLQALADSGAEIRIRMPLIKGINDDIANIEQTAAFIKGLAGKKKPVDLLPYHNIADNKYRKLGMPSQSADLAAPDKHRLEEIIATFADHGLTASVG